MCRFIALVFLLLILPSAVFSQSSHGPTDLNSSDINLLTTNPDSDHDGVDDHLDLCPLAAGLVELQGCPPTFNDFDSDGVTDGQDLCPYSTPGAGIGNGCKPEDAVDEDLDGENGDRDLCRWTEGYVDAGCPPREDSDRDGIINALDLCPTDYGVKTQNGCWNGPHSKNEDADWDGMDNERDQCSSTPAGAAIGPNGCALDSGPEDRDQDGVINARDLCPHSPSGHAVNQQGCTGIQAQERLDDDGDGVLNVLDQCPATPAVIPNSDPGNSLTLFGCRIGEQDRDFDGVMDHRDLCPDERGHRSFHGCISVPPDSEGDLSQFEDRCEINLETGELYYDSRGCYGKDWLDFDGDEVINGRDRCPASRPGKLTDPQGCNDDDRLDFDEDGLMNGMDLCPRLAGLPRWNGCAADPTDADEDGVDNVLDLCPYTPPIPTRLSVRGCGTSGLHEDQDGDGVEDRGDNCANTPVTDAVETGENAFNYPQGCSLRQWPDTDGDGVVDSLDACLDTPATTPVDRRGCPLPAMDHDGDQVPDPDDRCPATLYGRPLTTDGCEISKVALVIQPVRQVLPRATGKITISTKNIPVILDPLKPQTQTTHIEVGDFGRSSLFAISVNGRRLSVSVPKELFGREIHIPLRLRFAASGEVGNWFTLIVHAPDDLSQLIVNDPKVLAATGVTLRQVLNQMNSNSSHADPALELFRQYWDSQAPVANADSPFHCTGEVNGFPLDCLHGTLDYKLSLDAAALGAELDRYRLSVMVNRVDLHENWGDCGEYRLVFILPEDKPEGDPEFSYGVTFSRSFLSLDARVANPTPGNKWGCRPVVAFWRNISEVDDSTKAERLHEFFLTGSNGIEAAMSPIQFSTQGARIRGITGSSDRRYFSEHKLVKYCAAGAQSCQYRLQATTLQQNPAQVLFDEPEDPYRLITEDFQRWFPGHLKGLFTNSPLSMSNKVPDRFNKGQSVSSYSAHYDRPYRIESANFLSRMETAVQDRYNADGSPLLVSQVVARATAMTCVGCHTPTIYSDTRDEIGVLQLSDGSLLHQWPDSHGGTHTSEYSELSPALWDVFLPERRALFERLTKELLR